MELYQNYLRPLYISHFGVAPASAGDTTPLNQRNNSFDAGMAPGLAEGATVVVDAKGTGGLSQIQSIRKSRVVLTTEGVSPTGLGQKAGVFVPLMVGTSTEVSVITGHTSQMPGASGAMSIVDNGKAPPALTKNKVTTRIGSHDAAVAPHQLYAAGGDAPTGAPSPSARRLSIAASNVGSQTSATSGMSNVMFAGLAAATRAPPRSPRIGAAPPAASLTGGIVPSGSTVGRSPRSNNIAPARATAESMFPTSARRGSENPFSPEALGSPSKAQGTPRTINLQME
jgi:hypothetical protein